MSEQLETASGELESTEAQEASGELESKEAQEAGEQTVGTGTAKESEGGHLRELESAEAVEAGEQTVGTAKESDSGLLTKDAAAEALSGVQVDIPATASIPFPEILSVCAPCHRRFRTSFMALTRATLMSSLNP